MSFFLDDEDARFSDPLMRIFTQCLNSIVNGAETPHDSYDAHLIIEKLTNIDGHISFKDFICSKWAKSHEEMILKILEEAAQRSEHIYKKMCRLRMFFMRHEG